MTWTADGPQGNEAAKVRFDIVPYTRGIGLDLGCGPYKAWPHFIGVDNCTDTKLFGARFRPDVPVDTCEALPLFATESMDFVFSSHLLEHIEDHKAALAEWWRVIKEGGHLVLYLPHKDLYPNIGQRGANPDHKHDFDPEDVIAAVQRVARRAGQSYDLLEYETRGEGIEYSFYLVFRKIAGTVCTRKAKSKAPKACVVRYGGFGDMLQAASVFPGLKTQGFEVHVMTTPSGRDILKDDPHVDGFILQDKDQVQNEDLGAFWGCWERKFDKWINLSESVEATWLAHPIRMSHRWPAAVRHKYLDVNYLEFAHELAGVPFKPAVRFYDTPEEQRWAREQRKQDEYLIMFALSGSSHHKSWPHMDQAIAQILLDMPKARVILAGDMACKLLEAGWEAEPRVTLTSGEWKIRQTLAMAHQADCVVGPETGVLNSVAFAPFVRKVILLSHSSVKNLCRDWKNAAALAAGVPCYPCHRMHLTREFCPDHVVPVASQPWADDEKLVEQMTAAGHIRDGFYRTGAAACAGSIQAEDVVSAIRSDYERWRTRRDIQDQDAGSQCALSVG